MSDPNHPEPIDTSALLAAAVHDGPLWSIASAQLNANLLRLSNGQAIPEHVNSAVDVLLVVLAGRGQITIDADTYDLIPGHVIVIPRDVTGGEREGEARNQDRARFEQLRQELMRRIAATPELRTLSRHISFTEDDEGLRIDLVDEADFSMFQVGTDQLIPRARRLVGEVAQMINTLPNGIVVRGHTDALPYAQGRTMNNWALSAARAESTRATLQQSGVPVSRVQRIEGVADRTPFVPSDRYDPRNRRISITLAWQAGSTPTRPTPRPAAPAH